VAQACVQAKQQLVVVVCCYLQIQQAKQSVCREGLQKLAMSPLFTAMSKEVHFVVSFDSF